MRVSWKPACSAESNTEATADRPVETEPARGVSSRFLPVAGRVVDTPLRRRGADHDPLGGTTVTDDIALRLANPRGGAPLPTTISASFGEQLRTDLTGVRVHADAEADSLAAAVSATAFTLGSDIYFSRGTYSTSSESGRHLLAHELAHVAQNGSGSSSAAPTIGRASDPAEREADVVADGVLQTLKRRNATADPAQGPRIPAVAVGAAGALSRLRRQNAANSVGSAHPVIRRTIKVLKIDFNPVSGNVEANIPEVGFYATFARKVGENKLLKLYKPQLTNVLKGLKLQDFEDEDVNRLTVAIVKSVNAVYRQNKVDAWPDDARAAFTDVVRESLVENLKDTKMDAREADDFDTLVTAAGPAAMSRSKGAPTKIAVDALPPALKAEVLKCRGHLSTERAGWGVTVFDVDDLIESQLGGRVGESLQQFGSYQGNHTNRAGWLPTIAVPASPLDGIRAQIIRISSQPLKNAIRSADAGKKIEANAYLSQEFRARYDTVTNGMTADEFGDIALASLGYGVSTYVEFWLSSSQISRLIYEYVNKKFYVTAHYKWKDGYNPFFEITGVPAP